MSPFCPKASDIFRPSSGLFPKSFSPASFPLTKSIFAVFLSASDHMDKESCILLFFSDACTNFSSCTSASLPYVGYIPRLLSASNRSLLSAARASFSPSILAYVFLPTSSILSTLYSFLRLMSIYSFLNFSPPCCLSKFFAHLNPSSCVLSRYASIVALAFFNASKVLVPFWKPSIS